MALNPNEAAKRVLIPYRQAEIVAVICSALALWEQEYLEEKG